MFARLSLFALGAPTLAFAHPALDTARDLRAQRIFAAPTISAQAHDEAMAGQIPTGIEPVPGVAAPKAWGVICVDSPIEATWMALNDESRMAGRLPVSVSSVIGGAPLATPRQVFEFLPLPYPITDRWWVVDVAANPALYKRSAGTVWELSWTDAPSIAALDGTPHAATAAEGMQVAWTKGSWLLVDLGDGRTLVEYSTWSDPGGSLPAGPATRFGRGAIADTLRAVQQLAKEAEGLSRAGFLRPDGTPL